MLAVMGLMASPALAAEVHHFSLGSMLYQSEGGVPPTFVPFSLAGAEFPASAFDPSGVLWGSRTDGINRSLYTIDPTTGEVTFRFASPSPLPIVSFDFRQNGNTLELFGMAGDTLLVFNADTGDLLSSNTYGMGSGFPTTAYDLATGTYYGMNNGDITLYTLPFAGPATAIAPLTGVGDYLLAGGAWFESQYWSAFYDDITSTVKIGTINTTTAEFSKVYAFPAPQVSVAMGYALSPEPATLTLLTFGGLVLLRRRR